MGKPRVVVFLADGFEEVEAVTPIDYLRRAGADVTVAGVGTSAPVGARGIGVAADTAAESLDFQPDCIVLPGGMPGSANLAQSEAVRDACRDLVVAGGVLAAICAAPAVVLGPLGLLDGKNFTCYPGFEERVSGAIASERRVVTDGSIITARAAGTAGEFAMAVIQALFDAETARKVAEAVLLHH